ncbi:O-antigen ligase family protein [Sporosarcina sp. 6E9]|uniref:O-antigen ligase family protein n=1 Tax=Sporosarcina sp. 6E9 TaxID=2819235 RepID=UPI001B30F97F|nr:O-antigen ligase family protein [Sporosarcina sp. 6E9]
MQTRNRNLKVKLVFNGIIFSSLFIMGMQFTPFRFMDKEALIGPLIILTAILIYYLIFNREIIITKNSLLIAALSALFFMYYIANITARVPLKPAYMIYLAIIFAVFLFIGTFKNKVLFYPASIIFVFLYVNLLFLPRILTHMSLTNANSNGIIAFLLLFFCIINFRESNWILRIINIYNTLFLLYALFMVATSRAAMLAFLVSVFIYLVVKKSHRFVFPFIALLIVGSQAFTLFYLKAKGTTIGMKLNALTEKYTGKRFFSGRDRVWKESLEDVTNSGNIWTGLGNNTQHGEFNGYLHNFYVQLFYQSGIIGLLLMSALLLAIAYVAMKVKRDTIDHSYKILFAYFVGILFLQIFEGHLIYKFELISMLCWIIIALFVNKTLLMNFNSNEKRL